MFHFVANLKPYTFHRGRGVRRFDAYLLSIDHASQARRLLAPLRREGRLLIAEGGVTQRINSNELTREGSDELVEKIMASIWAN